MQYLFHAYRYLDSMPAARDLRGGLSALWRHVRHSRGRPDRLLWIVRRAMQIVAAGRLRSVLERHAVVDDLYADYPGWLARFDRLDEVTRSSCAAEIAAWGAAAPSITVVIPAFESDPRWLRAAVASVRAQVYPAAQVLVVDDGSREPAHCTHLGTLAATAGIRVHRRERNGGVSACLDTGLALVATEYVAFLDHDDALHPLALFRTAQAIVAKPDTVLLYSDEDRIDKHGRRSAPHFKPDWNAEWIRTTNYVLHLCVVRVEAARAAGGFRSMHDGVQDWDLVLRVSEAARSDQIVHVPFVLYHWRMLEGSTAAAVYHKRGIRVAQRAVIAEMLQRRRIRATVEASIYGWRIRYTLPEPPPLVSIVILTRDRVDLLDACTASVLSRTAYANYELVIVDHESREPAAVRLLQELRSHPRVRVVPYTGPFNYSAQCNRGVRHARGDIVVLLNNDVQVLDGDWLAELAGHAMQPDVALVGALLLYPNRTIQHAGVIVGLNGTADRPYVGYRQGYAGVEGRAQAAQDATAVVTACAAIRKQVFDEIGGFDETLSVSHNDIDLCLRAIARGYRNVFTPHAELIHAESASRGLDVAPAELARSAREAATFEARWHAWMQADPTYNPNLTLRGKAFALAYPPRSQTASPP